MGDNKERHMGDNGNLGGHGYPFDFSHRKNAHKQVSFSDNYSPAPTIVVSEPAIPEFPTSTALAIFPSVTIFLAALFKKKLV